MGGRPPRAGGHVDRGRLTRDPAGEPRMASSRLAGMPLQHRSRRLLPLAIAVLVSAAGCDVVSRADGPPSTIPASPPTGSTGPGGVTTDPSAGGDTGAGGGVAGNPGTGTASDLPLPIDPTPVDPGAGQPTLVVPVPGRQNPHPVAPTLLQASIDGRHVLVKISWYGGVAPCSVLDSVQVARGQGTVALTVIEGSSDLTAICPDLAMLKATIVDLGELEPGSWTISATNSDAAPIQLTIQ